MTNTTTDYHIFKMLDGNRPIKASHLERLKASIKLKNLLRLRPILVNKDMVVLDGQHRLEAAKQLCIPIHYQISEDARDEDIIELNANQKPWILADYLGYYCKAGNENYLKLREFLEKHKLSINSFMSIVLGERGGTSSTNAWGSFKTGKLVFEDSTSQQISRSLERLERLKEHIAAVAPQNCTFTGTDRFKKAALMFLSSHSVDIEMLMHKISVKAAWLNPRTTIKDYLLLLGQIYNFNNRTPIDVDDLLEGPRPPLVAPSAVQLDAFGERQ